jgi:uncharacterized protein YeaO (DUF488 family)
MSDSEPRIHLKRAYDPPSDEDGARVLVDRLWPRGLTRAAAHIDLWLKEVAPSEGLRRWFGHDPARFAEFARRYQAELELAPQQILTLRRLANEGPLTLIFGAKDREHNQAVVLADRIRGEASPSRRAPGET